MTQSEELHLSINLLGPFHATINSRPIPESRSKRIEALLAYLAVEHTTAHRRETLVGLLFPDMPDAQARTNLRQTLTRLRRAVQDAKAQPSYLLVTRESTQFNSESNSLVDVTVCTHALRGCASHAGRRDANCADCMASVGEGLALYRGDFMAGFLLEDAFAYDEWVLARRAELRQAVLAAARDLADYYERRGEYATAVPYTRQQIDIEPWQEAPHRQLMRLLAYQGERNAALQHYEKLRDILWDELGVDPMLETEALRDRIAAGLEERPYNLPTRDTTFVSRTEELAQLHAYLVDPQHRLVTLVGIGGSGKTALATEIGWRAATQFLGPFIHGVFFVPLAGLMASQAENTNALVTAVAETIGITFAGKRPPQDQLLDYLHDKSLLLILDNFEHLLAAGRGFLLALLANTNAVQIIVTSRERLNLAAEWTLPVGGLPALDSGAQDLFVQRARRLVPGFAVSGEVCPETAVNRICQLVQGLPLGIELAASWVRMLDCVEIAREIAQSLDFLQSSQHDLPARHQSLRAVFDYSWKLLDAAARQVLQRLAVFHGSFNRQAAAAVGGASLPQLSLLVDNSLLQRQAAAGGEIRFEMLEMLRQYALDKLGGHAAEKTAVRDQHAAFYIDFLEKQLPLMRGEKQQTTLIQIAQEIENVRAAWHWAVERGNFATLDYGIDGLALFYYMRSWFAEGVEMFTLVVTRLQSMPRDTHLDAIYAKLLARQGWFTFLSGQQQAGIDLLKKSLAQLQAAPDPSARLYSLNFLAAALVGAGEAAAAQAVALEGLTLGQQVNDDYYQAIANNILSQIAYSQAEYAAARDYCLQSLTLEEALGNRWSMGFSFTNLGRVAYATGDFTEAQKRYQESLLIRKEMDDKRGQGLCLVYLGDTAVAQIDLPSAHSHYTNALALFRAIGSPHSISMTQTRLDKLAQQEESDTDKKKHS